MYGWSSVSCVNNIESMSMCGEGTWHQTLHMNKLHIVPTHPELAIFLKLSLKATACVIPTTESIFNLINLDASGGDQGERGESCEESHVIMCQ